jgi:ribosomal protein S18 acetylase RimI-like enzyme
MVMKNTIRALTSTDEPFLWEMLYQAIFVSEGKDAPPREIVRSPELAKYVQGWGREGDCGFLSYDVKTGQPVGAVWLRQFGFSERGYGYIDEAIPELSIAVLPEYRGCGIGTQLLSHLFASDLGRLPVSLSVSIGNKGIKLYEHFGFEVVSKCGNSLIMKRAKAG